MDITQRTSLPAKWPGRSTVKLALTVLRVGGYWDDWLDRYARSAKWMQRHDYPIFRHTYYEKLTGLHPDGARRIGK
jgi:hypothetical protein